MTNTEMNCFGIPRETIEASMQRARRLRSRVVFRLARRMVRRLSLGFRTVTAPARPVARPA